MATQAITLEPLSPLNREAVIALTLAPGQSDYVASNAESIAEAEREPGRYPFAIRMGDAIVAFAMYALDPEDGHFWVYRFMVDASLQGRGIGRAALQQLLAIMFARPDCPRIHLGVVPGNAAAAALYASVGFRPTGEIAHGERIMALLPSG